MIENWDGYWAVNSAGPSFPRPWSTAPSCSMYNTTHCSLKPLLPFSAESRNTRRAAAYSFSHRCIYHTCSYNSVSIWFVLATFLCSSFFHVAFINSNQEPVASVPRKLTQPGHIIGPPNLEFLWVTMNLWISKLLRHVKVSVQVYKYQEKPPPCRDTSLPGPQLSAFWPQVGGDVVLRSCGANWDVGFASCSLALAYSPQFSVVTIQEQTPTTDSETEFQNMSRCPNSTSSRDLLRKGLLYQQFFHAAFNHDGACSAPHHIKLFPQQIHFGFYFLHPSHHHLLLLLNL